MLTPENILQEKLAKVKAELAILYEISNAMHTTLKLEEILYIILTGATAHIGLGFNRALLLLVNTETGILEGKMGIGPDSAESADSIWKIIDAEGKNLDDLIQNFSREKLSGSKFNTFVQSLSIPCDEARGGLLAIALHEGMSLHITKEKLKNIGALQNDSFLSLFPSEEFVIAPLKAKDKTIGLIVADNFVTHKPITMDDIRMFTMLSNQAGLAIESSQLYEQTLVLVHKDSLTGLWNHAYFQQLLDKALAETKEKGEYLSLLMIDLDDFKLFNDTWGHQKGDEMLVKIAKIFKDVFRKYDYVCRYGGEEFAIILPKTNLKEALAIAERIRVAVEQSRLSPRQETATSETSLLATTLSIGVATFPLQATSKSELILASDRALYEAKKTGKNKIISFSQLIYFQK